METVEALVCDKLSLIFKDFKKERYGKDYEINVFAEIGVFIDEKLHVQLFSISEKLKRVTLKQIKENIKKAQRYVEREMVLDSLTLSIVVKNLNKIVLMANYNNFKNTNIFNKLINNNNNN